MLIAVKKSSVRECKWYLNDLAEQLHSAGITIRKLDRTRLVLRTPRCEVRLYSDNGVSDWKSVTPDAYNGFTPGSIRCNNRVPDVFEYIKRMETGA